MTEYVKYSERNGIKNELLARIVDHLERVVGWDIQTMNTCEGYTSIISDKYKLFIFDGKVVLSNSGATEFEISGKIFQKEYINLLSHYKE